MTTKPLLLSLLCAVLLSVGQVMFKLSSASIQTPLQINSSTFFNIILNPFLLAGFAIYTVTTLLWVWVLKDTPLSLAYPITALAFIIVPVLSTIFINEPFQVKFIYGGALIILGVYVISK